MEIDNKINYKNYIIEEVKISKEEDSDKRLFKAIITSEVMDRDYEVLEIDGLNKKEFMNNPVIVLDHGNKVEDIAGRSISIRKSGISLAMEGEIIPEGISKKIDGVWELAKLGFLKGISIGYGIIQSRIPTKQDIEKYGKDIRLVINKWKLFHISLVPVGAQQNALITACKSLNIDPKDIIKDYKEEVIEEDIKDIEEEKVDVIFSPPKKEKRYDIKLIKEYCKEEIKEIIKEIIKY